VSNASRGADFERRIRKILEAEGYHVARSAASLGPYDLDASKPGQRLLVQAKCTGRGLDGIPKIDPEDWNALYDLAIHLGAVPVAVCRPAPRRPPVFWRMTGRKTGARGQRSPLARFELDEVAAALGGAA
jgi:Holliday junction resolvase